MFYRNSIYVSIPRGAVKSLTAEFALFWARSVSIPRGAVKSFPTFMPQYKRNRFQFQEVQLKGQVHQRFHRNPRVSIPRGAVKSNYTATTTRPHNLFQFQEVQLKELSATWAKRPDNSFNSKRCS